MTTGAELHGHFLSRHFLRLRLPPSGVICPPSYFTPLDMPRRDTLMLDYAAPPLHRIYHCYTMALTSYAKILRHARAARYVFDVAMMPPRCRAPRDAACYASRRY